MSYQAQDTTGTRIRWARENKRNLKAKELAAEIGVGHIYLSKIENDRANPSPEVMKKLAKALGVSRAFLEMETNDPVPALAQQEELPTYASREADEAARLIDEMPDKWRTLALEVVVLVAAHAANDSESTR